MPDNLLIMSWWESRNESEYFE